MADKLPPEELAAIRKRHHKTNQYCEISGCSWDSHYQANDDRAALLRHVEALEQEVERLDRIFWQAIGERNAAERKLARLVEELQNEIDRAIDDDWHDIPAIVVKRILAGANVETGEGK